jgi:hypothetical protein
MVELQKELTAIEQAIADKEKLDVLIGTLKVAEQDKELTRIRSAVKSLKSLGASKETIIERITAAYEGTGDKPANGAGTGAGRPKSAQSVRKAFAEALAKDRHTTGPAVASETWFKEAWKKVIGPAFDEKGNESRDFLTTEDGQKVLADVAATAPATESKPALAKTGRKAKE